MSDQIEIVELVRRFGEISGGQIVLPLLKMFGPTRPQPIIQRDDRVIMPEGRRSENEASLQDHLADLGLFV